MTHVSPAADERPASPSSTTSRRGLLHGVSGVAGIGVTAASRAEAAQESPGPVAATGATAHTGPITVGSGIGFDQNVADFADVGEAVNDLLTTYGGGPTVTPISIEGDFTVQHSIDPQLGSHIALDLTDCRLQLASGVQDLIGFHSSSPTPTSNWLIEGGLLVGNGSTGEGGSTGIRFHGSNGSDAPHDNIVVRNVTAREFYATGIALFATNSLIEQCVTIKNGAHGQLNIQGDNSEIRNGIDRLGTDYAGKDWYHAFEVERSRNAAIRNCTAFDTPDLTDCNAFSAGYAKQVTIEGCVTNGGGGRLYGGIEDEDVTIRNCRSVDCTNVDVIKTPASNGVVVESVRIEGSSSGSRISFPACRHVTVENVDAPGLRLNSNGARSSAPLVADWDTTVMKDLTVRDSSFDGAILFTRNASNGGEDLSNVFLQNVAAKKIQFSDFHSSWSDYTFDEIELRYPASTRGINAQAGMPKNTRISNSRIICTDTAEEQYTGFGLVVRKGGENLRIENCEFRNPTKSAMQLRAGTPYIADVAITNGNATGGTGINKAGIELSTDGGVVRGGRIEQSDEVAIYEDAPGARIEGVDTGTQGIDTNSGAAFVDVNPGFTGLSSPPSNPTAGHTYLDDGTNTSDGTTGRRIYDGSGWVDL